MESKINKNDDNKIITIAVITIHFLVIPSEWFT